MPFLATYLGHRDIHSTLVYITVTQDLTAAGGRALPHVRGALSAVRRKGCSHEAGRPVPQHCCAPSSMSGWSSSGMLPSIPFARTATPGACSSDSSPNADRRTVAQLRLGDLTASEVSAFLQYTEQERARLDRHTQLPSGRAAQLLRLCRRTGADSGRRSAPKSCAFRPRRRRCMLRPIWTRRK